MVRAERDGDVITVATEFRHRDLIRQVPGVTWDGNNRVWRAPLSWGSCKALRGVFADRLEVGPELTEWAWDEYKSRVEPCLALRQATCLAEVADDTYVQALLRLEERL